MIRSIAKVLPAAVIGVFVPMAGAQTLAITNAHLLTMSPAGELARATVLIRDGRIVEVGADVAVPHEAQVIEAAGDTITPGLVATGTGLGAVEVRSLSEANDLATSGHNSAAFDVQYGLNRYSVALPVARQGGITRAIVTPTYTGGANRGLAFAGLAAAIHLGGGDILVRPRVAMVLDLGERGAEMSGGARGAAFVAIRSVFDQVREPVDDRSKYQQRARRSDALGLADLHALVPVLRGRVPLIVSVHRAEDIRQVLALAREQALRVILRGAEEGWLLAEEIAAAEVPVILDPLSNLPTAMETLAASLTNAAQLQRAGVLIAFESRVAHRAHELRYDAGTAVAHGLSHGAALAAVTINPARMFGLSERFGSLTAGKDADLVIWDGDPFEPLTRAKAVFVRGELQEMTSRRQQLHGRYGAQHGEATDHGSGAH